MSTHEPGCPRRVYPREELRCTCAPASPPDSGPLIADEVENHPGEKMFTAPLMARPTDCGPPSEDDFELVERIIEIEPERARSTWGPAYIAALFRVLAAARQYDELQNRYAVFSKEYDKLFAEVARLQEQEKVWRRLLWLRHDASHAAGLYGDDGEMQCNMAGCMIDFLRDDPADIEQRWINASLARAALSTTEWGEP